MSWTLILVEEWALSHTALYLFVSSPFPCPNALWVLKFYLKAGTNGPLNVPFSRVGLVSSRHAGPRKARGGDSPRDGAAFSAWLRGSEEARLRWFLVVWRFAVTWISQAFFVFKWRKPDPPWKALGLQLFLRDLLSK